MSKRALLISVGSLAVLAVALALLPAAPAPQPLLLVAGVGVLALATMPAFGLNPRDWQAGGSEHAFDAIVTTDLQGSITSWNQGAQSLYGLAAGQALGKPVSLIVPPAAAADLQAAQAAIRRGEAPPCFQTARLGASGVIVEVSVAVSPVRADAGEIAGYCEIARPYSAPDNADEKFRLAVEGSPHGVIMVDAAGKIVLANTEAGRLFGYSAAEFLSLRVEQLVPGHLREGHVAQRNAYMQAPSARRMGANRELAAVRKDGSEFPVEIGLTPIQSSQGLMVLGAIVDVSQRKLLSAQLQQAQKMEAVGQLAGGVAHDFNNLLTVIFLSAGLLKADLKPDDELQTWVADIQRAAERARNLTERLLTLSSRRPVQPSTIDLNQAVSSFHKVLRRVIPSSIELDLLVAPAPVWVRADASQLEQVLMNMVMNARDATPPGGRISVRVAREGDSAQITIKDTGTGMSPETLRRVFEPFFTTKAPGHGTGLGLAVCYGIISQAGGEISGTSTLGSGTEFTVRLPIVQAPAVTAERDAPRAAPATGPAHETILVADDSPELLEVARLTLVHHGYTVLTAGNGEEALRILQARDGAVDLVLSDIVMPQMTGRELLEKASALWPKLPFVLMTGYADPRVVGDVETLQQTDLIEKPFQAETLLSRVRQALDRRRG